LPKRADSPLSAGTGLREGIIDSIAIERFWTTLKQDEVYLLNYESPAEARHQIGEFIRRYNEERRYSSIGDRNAREVYSNIRTTVTA
jgi:putative transposase